MAENRKVISTSSSTDPKTGIELECIISQISYSEHDMANKNESQTTDVVIEEDGEDLFTMSIFTKFSEPNDAHFITIRDTNVPQDHSLHIWNGEEIYFTMLNSISSKNVEALRKLAEAMSHPDLRFEIGDEGVSMFKLKLVDKS